MSVNSKIIEFLNRVNYSVFLIYYFFRRYILRKVTEKLISQPFYNIGFIKRRLKKYGVNSYEEYMGMVNNATESPSSLVGSYFISKGTSAIFMFTLLTFIQFLVGVSGAKVKWYYHNYFSIIIIILAGVVCLLLWETVWKDGREKKYFAKFQKESQKKCIVWSVCVAIYIVLVTFAWLYSMTLT